MRKIKTLLGLGILTFSMMSMSVYAEQVPKRPAEILATLTGESVEEVKSKRQTEGKTYGQLANEAGVLEQFKAEMLANRVAYIQEQVKNGKMTQEEGDARIAKLTARMEKCDGTGEGHTKCKGDKDKVDKKGIGGSRKMEQQNSKQ